MINWQDKSDRICRFYDGGAPVDLSVDEALASMLEQLCANVIGKGNAVNFDLLLFEVNCDTGRVLTGATTEKNRGIGTDGCSLRIQNLQDIWYDLLENGASDEEFTQGVSRCVLDTGRLFRKHLEASLNDLRQHCSLSGFNFVVFGNEPGVRVLEETITRAGFKT